MSESPLKGPVPEDVLAVAGHCCSVRLTRLPELEDGIDFTPDAAARAAFELLQSPAADTPPARGSGCGPTADEDTCGKSTGQGPVVG